MDFPFWQTYKAVIIYTITDIQIIMFQTWTTLKYTSKSMLPKVINNNNLHKHAIPYARQLMMPQPRGLDAWHTPQPKAYQEQ